MVLIFSMPVRTQIASKPEKSSFISSISAAGVRRADDLREPDDVAEQDADRLVAIRDHRLARLQPVDDPLRQHVEQQPLRPRSLGLELGEQPRRERRVRVLELLEPANVVLEPLEAPSRDGGSPSPARRGSAGRQARTSSRSDLVRRCGPEQDRDHRRVVESRPVGRGHRRDLPHAVQAADRHRVARGPRARARSRDRLASRAGTFGSRTRRAARRLAGRRPGRRPGRRRTRPSRPRRSGRCPPS